MVAVQPLRLRFGFSYRALLLFHAFHELIDLMQCVLARSEFSEVQNPQLRMADETGELSQ